MIYVAKFLRLLIIPSIHLGLEIKRDLIYLEQTLTKRNYKDKRYNGLRAQTIQTKRKDIRPKQR